MNEPGRRVSPFRVVLALKLGTAQREIGDLAAAQETLAKAFESAQRAGDRRLLLAAGRELGITLLAASNLYQAEQVLRQMLEVTAEHYGADSPEWAATAEELALALRARGDAPAAVRLQREALETARGALGERDPMTLVLGMNFASATRAHRLFVPSSYFIVRPGQEERERNPFWVSLKLFMEKRPDVEQGSFLTPLPWLQELPEARAFLFAAPTRDWATQIYNVSPGEAPEKPGEEIDLARQIWEGYSEALGERHPQTLYSMQLLSRAEASRDVDVALELGREAAEASEAVLGRGHLDTLTALETVAALLELRGESAAAVDLRRKNVMVRAGDEGIHGNAQPPIENLAGSLTEPPALLARGLTEPHLLFEEAADEEGGPMVIAGAGASRALRSAAWPEVGEVEGGQAGDELVRRGAHIEFQPSRPIEQGDRFEVSVYVDCRLSEDEDVGELTFRPPPDVTELELRAWLVVSRHFEIEGPAVQPLLLDLREETSPRVVFEVQALHVREFSDEEPEVRVLFSYNEWPSGEVRRGVPLNEAAVKESP